MPQTLGTYAAYRVGFVWGVTNVTGFVDGSFISAKRTVQAVTMRVGADGEAARSIMANRSGEVTCTLMASSDTNFLLSAQQQFDEASGSAVFPLLIKDSNATLDLCSAPFAWVTGPPDMEKALEIGEVTWTFHMSVLNILHGGIKKHI